MVITNLAAGQVSIVHGLKGPNYSVTSACASGAHSIGEATNYIRNGVCDVMVAGGAEKYSLSNGHWRVCSHAGPINTER